MKEKTGSEICDILSAGNIKGRRGENKGNNSVKRNPKFSRSVKEIKIKLKGSKLLTFRLQGI